MAKERDIVDQIAEEFQLSPKQKSLVSEYALGHQAYTTALLGGGHGHKDLILMALDGVESDLKTAQVSPEVLDTLIARLYPPPDENIATD